MKKDESKGEQTRIGRVLVIALLLGALIGWAAATAIRTPPPAEKFLEWPFVVFVALCLCVILFFEPLAGILKYMRTRDSIHRKNSPFYGPERFTYQPESNSYRCPAGQQLNYGGRSDRNRTYVYIGTRKRCGTCAQRPQCTSAAFRCLAIHMHEPVRQRARELARTPEFAKAQRQRKKVEALFAELKNQIGLRCLRLRRLKFVREQFFLAATAQNLKRLMRFLSKAPTPTLSATT